MKKYYFYIELEDGITIEWVGLTLANAQQMDRLTKRHGPNTIQHCGYEEMT